MKGSKFIIVLPSSLLRSFFQPTIANIINCLRLIKLTPLFLDSLQYVLLVGGFSSSPLIQAAARAELEGGNCAVVAALRPDVAIVRGAVLFANKAEVFTSRQARLTYGIATSIRYNRRNSEHVRRRSTSPRFDDKGKEMITAFDGHIKVGQDIPQYGVCPVRSYWPILRTQKEICFKIYASHRSDVAFPDEDCTFLLGHVSVPLNTKARFENRGVDVSSGASQGARYC